MSDANNIPTDDKVFTPLEPSDVPTMIEDVEITSDYGDDDPAQAVDLLIKNMPAQRKALMGILELCRDITSMDDVKERVDEIAEYYPMVYTAADLCTLLEEKDAIECVYQDGSAYDTSTLEPSIVEDEKGYLCYQANEPADMYWHTTDAGTTILDDDDPLGRAQAFFDEDPDVLPIYKRVLKLCDKDDGISITDLETAVDHDPLVQDPRLYVPFFLDRLEKADAVEWKDVWRRTDIGDEALTLLSDVEDDYAYDE